MKIVLLGRFLFFMMAVALIAGCAAKTYRDVKADPDVYKEITLQENYQRIYRTVSDNARNCYGGSFIGGHIFVESNLYSDLNEGTVIAGISSSTGKTLFFIADIIGQSKNSTKVKLYGNTRTGKKLVPVIQGWLLDDKENCN